MTRFRRLVGFTFPKRTVNKGNREGGTELAKRIACLEPVFLIFQTHRRGTL